MGCGSVNSEKFQKPEPALSLNRIYQRLHPIGKGTFGTVYLCRNNLNGLYYALKVVEITAKSKDEAIRQVQNLKRQIGVLKKLNHQNIVKYYSFDIAPDGKQVEIVLEYAERGSLKQYVREKGQLKEQEASTMVSQILEGLSYLHSQNIVHRDLKCANILIMSDGTLKITDFGTAKHIKSTDPEDIAQNASLKGTPYYMAPQILRRKGHSIPVDVWSLGCLVIEMLTGKAPWTSLTNDFEEIIGYIVSGIHPPFPKNLSEDCEEFLNSCLDNVPSQRLKCIDLLNLPWINGKKGKDSAQKNKEETLAKYKNSLSKTDDGVDEIQERIKQKEDKMKQIEVYMGQKTRQRQKRRQVDRESAGAKKGKSGNILFSQKYIEKDEIQVLQCEPVSRQLFTEQQQKPLKMIKNAQTAPHVKLPQTLIPDLKIEEEEDLQGQFLNENYGQTKRVGQAVINTVISREERARYMEQQRVLRQQREMQRNKWQQQLKEGANYLKKEINSRYIP